MSITLEHLSYVYNPGTAYEKHALKDISLEIPQGQFVGIIGHTGSGKSTLIQHLNGLMKATSGRLLYEGKNIYEEGYDMKQLRTQVGLVFQYPEYQLFEVDVLSDVCFGPKNQGLSKEECEAQAKEALQLVGFPEKYYHQSPFELSGGQKRRVAIAGILAMHPKVLVLDEPTAGLDPKGRDEILDQVAQLHEKTGMTVVLVSHSMEDVAKYVDRLIVMNQGEKMLDGTPQEVFRHYKELEAVGLAAPQVTYVMHDLKEKGLVTAMDVASMNDKEEMQRYVIPSLKYVDYLIVNEIEGGELAEMELRREDGSLNRDAMEKAARKLMTMGVQKCCVLHAPEMGCAVDSEGNYVEEPSLKLPDGYIVGTVGAGDSFCAGILYSIYKKLSMDEALKIAAASAAANLSAGDSVGGLRSIEETMKLYDAYSPRK